MQSMRLVFTRIKEAVAYTETHDDEISEALTDLLKDIGFHNSQLVMECWQVMKAAKWDWRNQSVREQSFSLHAGQSTTKMACEDTFNWLAATCQRQSKGYQKFNKLQPQAPKSL